MVRDHAGVLHKKAEYWRIPVGIVVGAVTPTYDTIDAKAIFFMSNAALEVRIPLLNPDGTISEVAHLPIEVAANTDGIVNSTASKVGYISGSIIPPFFTLKVSGAATNSLGAVYITF